MPEEFVMERMPDQEYYRIKLRGEAPSRQSAAQIRADYTALLGEIQRLRRERGSVRYLLAQLALGEVLMGEVVGRLGLQDEIDRTVATNKANAAYSASLREGMWWGDEPDDDEDVEGTPVESAADREQAVPRCSPAGCVHLEAHRFGCPGLPPNPDGSMAMPPEEEARMTALMESLRNGFI